MALDVPLVFHTALDDYALPVGDHHGIAHRARVLENGPVSPGRPGPNVEVVGLFAVLHGSRRFNEATDPDHGPRAVKFAPMLRGRLFDLTDHEFRLQHRACAGHTHERTQSEVTIQTCWDADRLDLGWVGIPPLPSHLGTEVASRPETIRWADGRERFPVVPPFAREEWGIGLTATETRDIENLDEGEIEWPSEL